MKVSHKAAILESPAIERMCRYLEERKARWENSDEVPDLETVEKGLHECVMEIEREAVAEELSRYDVVAESIEVEGEVYQKVLTSSATYHCGAGEVRVEHHLYRAPGRGQKSICPLEMQSGIVMGLMTPSAARQSAYIMAHLPASTAEELLAEIGNLTPSRSTLGKVPTALSEVWEAHREEWECEIRSTEVVPQEAAILVVSQDGGMAPMKDGEPTKKRSQENKQPSGPAGYKEVGCGTVSLYDDEGTRLNTVKYGRMPEKNKATLHRQLEAECQSILPLRPDLTVVKVADGAKDNWQSLGSLDFALEPDAPTIHQVEFVDFFHAADHLSDACNAIWGKAWVKTKDEFERLRILLKEHEQGVEKVIHVLRYHIGRVITPSRKEVIRNQLTYFRNQRHLMRYAHYLAQGLPIASGVVEATCKTLVTQRMKCSGMAWKQTGGQAILTLRSLIQSDPWQHAYLFLMDAFCTPLTILA